MRKEKRLIKNFELAIVYTSFIVLSIVTFSISYKDGVIKKSGIRVILYIYLLLLCIMNIYYSVLLSIVSVEFLLFRPLEFETGERQLCFFFVNQFLLPKFHAHIYIFKYTCENLIPFLFFA